MTTEGNESAAILTKGAHNTDDVGGIRWGGDTDLFRVRANGWMVVGKPTLRALLRYWWRSR